MDWSRFSGLQPLHELPLYLRHEVRKRSCINSNDAPPEPVAQLFQLLQRFHQQLDSHVLVHVRQRRRNPSNSNLSHLQIFVNNPLQTSSSETSSSLQLIKCHATIFVQQVADSGHQIFISYSDGGPLWGSSCNDVLRLWNRNIHLLIVDL